MVKSHRERIVAILEKYEPAKVGTVDNMLKVFAGKEEALIRKLVKQMGPEPTDGDEAIPPKSIPTDASPPAKPPAKKGKKKVAGKKPPSGPSKEDADDGTPEPESEPSPSPPASSPGKKKGAKKKVPAPPGEAEAGAVVPPKPAPKGKKGVKRPAVAPSDPPASAPKPAEAKEMIALDAEEAAPVSVDGPDPHGLRLDRAVTEARLARGAAAVIGTQPTLPTPLLAQRATKPYLKRHNLPEPKQSLRREALLRTLTEFYEVVAPDRVGKVGLVVESFQGDELRLFSQLEAKYRNGAEEAEEETTDLMRKQSTLQRRMSSVVGPDRQEGPPAGVGALRAAESSLPPVYPFGHLQRRFNAFLVRLSGLYVYRERILEAYRQLDTIEQFEAAREAGYEGTINGFAAQPMSPERVDETYAEIDELLASHPGDEAAVVESVFHNLATLFEEAGQEVPRRFVIADGSDPDVWLEVSEAAIAASQEEDEWDRALTDYLVNSRVKKERTGLLQRGAERKGAEVPAAVKSQLRIDQEATANASRYSKASYVDGPMIVVDPTLVHQKDAEVWKMVHLRHRKLRRSLFCGEVLADVALPSGAPAISTVRRYMKGSVDGDPTTLPATPTLANAMISTGYASTCDVTPRQQVTAIVMKYCPEKAPLVLPALWQYRGREHVLIQRLHAQYGVNDAPASDQLRLSRRQADDSQSGPDGVGGSDGDPVLVAPRVGSEHYLADVMHGQVCGLSKEIEVDSNLIVKSAAGKSTVTKYPVCGPVEHMPAFAYPCEDASFRSWSNIPSSLQAVASMARHYGLGPQFVHQLHAQNPLDPDACAYELLCFLFPDAVYWCLEDDEQRLAFMTKRTSELMSFVKQVDPRFTRPQPGAPRRGIQSTDRPLNAGEAIPRLMQKYSPLTLETDYEHEKAQEEASRPKGRFVRKPAKDRAARLLGDDASTDDDGDREARFEDLNLEKNHPERALADAFQQHFGELLGNVQRPSMRWGDMYRYAAPSRHNVVLAQIDAWAGSFGPLPSAEAITLDIMRTAQAAAAEAKALRELMEAKEKENRNNQSDLESPTEITSTPGGAALDSPLTDADGLVPDLPGASQTQNAPLFTSSGASLHLSPQFVDPKGELNSRHSRLLEVPSLAHRYVCQRLTRSTPFVFDSVLKGYLKDTREVATMTHHAEEAAIAGLLYKREQGTSTTLDSLTKVTVKGAWPPEGLEDRLSEMPIAQLRKLRHRVLFGDRPEVGPDVDPHKRMSYKRRVDPERAARREHNKMYFGASVNSDDDSDGIHDDNNPDAVFGVGDAPKAYPNSTYPPALHGEVRSYVFGDPDEDYWFDQPQEQTDGVQDYELAAATSGSAVVALVRKFRRAREMLRDSHERLSNAAEEIDSLKQRCANGVVGTLSATGRSCSRCESLEGRVRALMSRLHDVRHGKGFIGVESPALTHLLEDMSREMGVGFADRPLPPVPAGGSLFQNPAKPAAKKHTLSLLDML